MKKHLHRFWIFFTPFTWIWFPSYDATWYGWYFSWLFVHFNITNKQYRLKVK